MVVICAVCASAETYGDFDYSVLDDGTVKLQKYIGSAEKVEIPEKINGKRCDKYRQLLSNIVRISQVSQYQTV